MVNYREMWQSLGMDLEAYDQLCQVLPITPARMPNS